MFQRYLPLPLLLVSSIACAETTFTNSIGLGGHYGGLGWQGRLSGETMHGRLGLGVGFFGASVGLDVSATERFLVGVTYGDTKMIDFRAVTITFAPAGITSRGVQISLDLGSAELDDDFLFNYDEGEEVSGVVGLNVGYAF